MFLNLYEEPSLNISVSPWSPPHPAAPLVPVSPATFAPDAVFVRFPPQPAEHKQKRLNIFTRTNSDLCVLLTHPVSFDEANKDGEEDRGRHRLGALSKKLYCIFKCILK